MKKLFFLPILFILSFGFSDAQDTIIFKNNPTPVICKIRSITQTNIFYIVNGEYLSDYMSNVKYCSKPSAQTKMEPTATQTNNNTQPIASKTNPADVFNPSGYLALSIGAGFPLGKYKDSGFANTGYNLSFSGAKRFNNSNFGVAFKIDYSANSVNQAEILSSLNGGAQNPYLSTSVNSLGHFSDETFLAGFFAVSPGNKLSFEIRALIGLMFANVPAINIDVYEYGIPVGGISQPGASATALCFDFGAALRYKITQELSAIANFDFTYSDPQFSISASANAQTSSGTQTYTNSGNESQVFELANLTIGLAWTPLNAK